MQKSDNSQVDETLNDFDRIMNAGAINHSEPEEAASNNAAEPSARFNIDPEKTRNGLAQLVLAVVKLLHELLEQQAIRRIDAGALTDEEIERIGIAMMGQSEEIDRIRLAFELKEEDLNIDLGPLGKLL